MITLLIILCVWLIGAFVSFKFFISKWDNSTFEKIWFTMLWPVLIILYPIHWTHNNL